MARAEKYITDLNKTKWKGKQHDWYYGIKPVRRGYYLGNIIYNNAQYELEVPNIIEVEATGGDDALNLIHNSIVSRKTDIDGKQTDQTYRIVPENLTIPPNTTTESIFVPFEIIQERSALSVTTQCEIKPPSSESISFSNLTITNIYYNYNNASEQYIPASGGTAVLTVEYSAIKTTSTETTTKSEPINGIATNVNIETSSSNNYPHVTFYDNGDVYAESLYDSDHYSTFELVRIKKLNISVDFYNEKTDTTTTLTDTWLSSSTNNDIICYQQYNVSGDPIQLGRVFTVGNGYVDEPGGTIYIDVTSYNRVYYIYTSKYQTPEQHVATGGRVTDKDGLTVTPETWSTKSQELSVTVGRNASSSDRYFYIKITNGYEEKTSTITQSGSSATITSYIYKNIRKQGSLGADIISARGGASRAVDVEVALICDKYAVWSDGRETIDTYNYGFSQYATNVTGDPVDGTGGGTTNGLVYADSRGTYYDVNERHVFTIKTVTVYVNNSYITFDGYSYKVWLAENIIISTSGPTAVLNCSDSSFSYDARGGSDKIVIESYYETVYTYSSREKDYEYESISTTISTLDSSVAYPSKYSTSSDNETVWIYTNPNTSTSSTKSTSIKITQKNTGNIEYVDISVGKNKYTHTCTGYELYDVYTSPSGDVPASGGSVQIKVKYRNTCGDVSYADGSWKNETYDDVTCNATSLKFGSEVLGTVSGGKITVDSRYQSTGGRQQICYITGGKTSEYGSFSCSLYVHQQANSSSDSSTYYFNVSPTSGAFDARGGTMTVTVNSYYETYRSFTSGDGYSLGVTNVTSNISTSNSNVASISATAVSGKNKTFTITVSKNTSTASTRSATITVKLDSTGRSSTISIDQEKDYHTQSCTGFVPTSVFAEEIPASGGSSQVKVTYTNKCNTYSYATGLAVGTGTSETKTVNATSLTTDTSSNIGTASGGVVSVGSRGTAEEPNSRKVYNIIGGSTSLGSFSLSGAVYQEGNTWEDSTSYTFTSTPTSEAFDAKGGSTTVTVQSYSTVTRTFASGQNKISSTSALGITATSSNTSVASVGSISGTTTKTFVVSVSINTSTASTRSATITITLNTTGTKKTLSISLEKDYTTLSCTGFVPVSVFAEDIFASGGTVQVQVKYKNTCGNYSYATGQLIGSATETNQTVNATSIKSNTSSNIGTTSNGKVTAGSRGQSTGGRRVVYSISGGTTSLGSFSLSGSVYQEANDDLGQSVSNVVSISKTSPSGNVSNSGGSAVFAVSATYSGTHDYTAGSYPINGNTTASIAATSGYSSLSPTSITGSGSVTLKLGANYSAAKTYTVTATAGSVSKSASVTQDGVVLSIVPEQTSIPADSAATTVYVICTSTLNGSANKPTVTSNQSWATVGTISSSGTTYTIPVSLTSNTSTTVDRIATITLYAASGTVSVTKTVTITQSKYVPAKPSKLVKFNGYFSFGQSSSGVNYSVVNIQPLESGFAKATFSAIEDSSYIYTGGTFNYYFVVSSSKTISGKITQTSTYSITVSKGSSTAISPVSITGASSAANYVLIYVNGSLFETHMIEQPEAQ